MGPETVPAPRLNPVLARQRTVILTALIATTVLAWAWVAFKARGSMPMPMTGLGLTMGMAAWPFLVMWTVMMVGMMFPASAPMILVFSSIQTRRCPTPQTYVPVSVFTAAYMLVWIVFGVAAFGLAAGIDALAGRSAWLMSHWSRIAAGLILVAGVYQFTPWKNVCLRRCRMPLGFLLEHWQDGWWGAFVMGVKHGLYCAGCCWLLFVILVPLGVMNLVAMGIVTVIVFAEKTMPGGERTARIAGAALLVFGTVALIRPGYLPGAM